MTQRSMKDVLQVMNDMAGLEVALAELYQACSEQYPEDQAFWLAIKRQEELHAQFIGKLAELISSHPQEFRFGRPFNSVAIKTILSNVKDHTAQVRKGQLQRQRALFIARDIENSVLESNYREIVTTDNVEFRNTIDLIAKDTLAHRNLLAAKVAKTKG